MAMAMAMANLQNRLTSSTTKPKTIGEINMATLPSAFDSNQHDDMQGAFDPIPADTYQAQITGSSVEDTKAKNGKYIKLEFTILSGEYKGRKIWTNLNIINPNPVAVEIAQKELATLCRACGKPVIQDTQEIHGVPFNMKVKITPAKGDWPAGNAPCGYESLSGAGAPPAATGSHKEAEASGDASAPSSSGVPWQK